MVKNQKIIMRAFRKLLKQLGFRTYVVSQALSGSCYFRFKDERIGKVRIGDHDERKRYGYRWQIRLDITEPIIDNSKGHKQFFYPPTMLKEAASHIVRYHAGIIRNSTLNENPPRRNPVVRNPISTSVMDCNPHDPNHGSGDPGAADEC